MAGSFVDFVESLIYGNGRTGRGLPLPPGEELLRFHRDQLAALPPLACPDSAADDAAAEQCSGWRVRDGN